MENERVIGLLSPGEMGSQVGRVLHENGARVLTSVEGRSDATKQRAAEAGLLGVPDLDTLVRSAEVILDIVPPSVPRGQGGPRGPRALGIKSPSLSAPHAEVPLPPRGGRGKLGTDLVHR